MSNLSFSPAATLAITGITPGSGPTSSVKINSSFTGAATAADDRIAETFTINANTTATVIDLGKIVDGKALWVECDGGLEITLTQDFGSGPVDNKVLVDKFMYLITEFTGVKVANPSATTAVHLSIIVAGNRLPVGGGPGVF